MSERTKVTMASERDGRYAWVVLMASFTGAAILYGVLWSGGIFYTMFLENLPEASHTQAALAPSLLLCVHYLSCTVSGALSNNFESRNISMIGSLLLATGFITSSLAANIYQLYVTFGILTGIGTGLAYIPLLSAVGIYFSKYQSLALGLAGSGIGTGTLVMPAVITHLNSQYDWRGTLLILGGIELNVLVCACLLRPFIQDSTTNSSLEIHRVSTAISFDTTGKRKTLLNAFMFSSLGFVLVCINSILLGLGSAVVYVHLSKYTTTHGYLASEGAMLYSTMGGANMIGRILFGAMNQCQRVGTDYLFMAAWMVVGLLVAAVPWLDRLLLLHAFAICFGLFSGCWGPLLPKICIELFGEEYFASGLGYTSAFIGVGSLIGGPIAACLYEVTGSYPASFYLASGCIFLGTILIAFLRRFARPRKEIELRVHDVSTADKRDHVM